MEPDGGGEIYFSCEPVKFTKAVQVKKLLLFVGALMSVLFLVHS